MKEKGIPVAENCRPVGKYAVPNQLESVKPNVEESGTPVNRVDRTTFQLAPEVVNDDQRSVRSSRSNEAWP